MTSLILAGLGVAGVALTARVLTRSLREVQKRAASLPKSPMFTSYYKGGFEKKMSRREAGLILGRALNTGYCLPLLNDSTIQAHALVKLTRSLLFACLDSSSRNKSVVREGEDRRGSQEDNVIESS